MLVAAIVALGIGAAWCTVAGWVARIITSALRPAEDYEQLLVSVEGQPLITRTSRSEAGDEQVLTLDGQPVKTSRQDLLYPQMLQHPDQRLQRSTPEWDSRITSANDGGTPEVYWYLIHDGLRNGRAYGVGFHSKTKLIVGYFGREGFANVRPPREQWFEIRGDDGLSGATGATNVNQPYFSRASDALIPLLANDKLFVIDVARREVKALVDCPAAEQVGSVWRLPKKPPHPDPDALNQAAQLTTPTDVLVRQPDSVLVVDHRTGKHTAFPLPADARHAMLAGFLLADGSLLLEVWDLRHWQEGEDLLWIAPSGEVVKRRHVLLAGRYVRDSEASFGWFAALVAPAPIASGVVLSLSPMVMAASGQADSYAAGFFKMVRAIWLSVLVVVLAGVGCAVGAYRRQRRLGLPHAGAWAAFTFILGVPGWIAYRFHRGWPVLEECPACHQAAPRDREACLDCGAVFPQPGLKGIEVFA
jgi:hypothetical protein